MIYDSKLSGSIHHNQRNVVRTSKDANQMLVDESLLEKEKVNEGRSVNHKFNLSIMGKLSDQRDL